MTKTLPVIFATLLLLSACQTRDVAEQEKCPLSQLDTHEQQQLCHHLKAENPVDTRRAAYVRDKMNEMNCGLFF